MNNSGGKPNKIETETETRAYIRKPKVKSKKKRKGKKMGEMSVIYFDFLFPGADVYFLRLLLKGNVDLFPHYLHPSIVP